MLGLQAWGDGLIVILFEFLDDDTKLAQSCRNWLYVQHWHTVVPEPSMRVTLWVLMGAGGIVGLVTQQVPLLFFSLFSRFALICITTATALAGTAVRIVLYPHSVLHICVFLVFCSRLFWTRSPVRQFGGFGVVAGAALMRALSNSHTETFVPSRQSRSHQAANAQGSEPDTKTI